MCFLLLSDQCNSCVGSVWLWSCCGNAAYLLHVTHTELETCSFFTQTLASTAAEGWFATLPAQSDYILPGGHGCLWSGLGRTMEILPVLSFSTLYLLIPCSSWGVLALLSRRCRTTTFYGTYFLFNIKIYYLLILKFSLLVLICLWVFCICPVKYSSY